MPNSIMVISHQHKFIFIHNYKVAGTSIRNSLKPFGSYSYETSNRVDKLKYVLGIYPKIFSKSFPPHIKAAELMDTIPKNIYQNYFKFGFVRNPWDWQVSLYTYMLKFENHQQHKLIKSMKNFDEYIDWRVHNDLHLQKEFFYKDNECLMNFIGKMENLENDFIKICKRVNITANLTHINKSRTDREYLKYYSEKSLQMVNQAFSEDIKIFRYTIPSSKQLI